jgi:hypothetical protein
VSSPIDPVTVHGAALSRTGFNFAPLILVAALSLTLGALVVRRVRSTD